MKIGAGSVIGSKVPVGDAASAAAFFFAASSIAFFFAASSTAAFFAASASASAPNVGVVVIFFTPLATTFFCPVKLLP
jgi:hypothetical protein